LRYCPTSSRSPSSLLTVGFIWLCAPVLPPPHVARVPVVRLPHHPTTPPHLPHRRLPYPPTLHMVPSSPYYRFATRTTLLNVYPLPTALVGCYAHPHCVTYPVVCCVCVPRFFVTFYAVTTAFDSSARLPFAVPFALLPRLHTRFAFGCGCLFCLYVIHLPDFPDFALFVAVWFPVYTFVIAVTRVTAFYPPPRVRSGCYALLLVRLFTRTWTVAVCNRYLYFIPTYIPVCPISAGCCLAVAFTG